MAKKAKKKKQRAPRKDFAQKLAEKLCKIGEVEADAFGDESGRWVNLRIGDTQLCFSFDMKGEIIDRIGLYKDKIEVTDQIHLWGGTAK